MAKQMLIDATRGKSTEKAPWVPYAGVNCAYLIGEQADDYFKDSELLAKGVVEAARKYRADGIPLTFDLSLDPGLCAGSGVLAFRPGVGIDHGDQVLGCWGLLHHLGLRLHP